MKSSLKIGATFLCLAAISFLIPTFEQPRVAAESVADLDALEIAKSETAYCYFDAPKSLTADFSGIYVSTESGVVSVLPDATVFSRFDINADKAYRYSKDNNGYFVTLEHGSVYAYKDASSPVSFDSHPIVDIDVEGNSVYMLGTDRITVSELGDSPLSSASSVLVFSSDEYTRFDASSVAVMNGTIYVALRSPAFKNKRDIATVDPETGVVSVVYSQANDISALSAMDHSDVLYALTRDRIVGYTASDSMLSETYEKPADGAVSIHAFDGFIYALDDLDGLLKISERLDADVRLSASASDADGFFNTPSGIAVKNGTLFVADTANDRIAKYSEGVSYEDGKFVSPVSVASDGNGTLYVAYDRNKIYVSSRGYDSPVIVPGTIKKILVNAERTLYILSSDGVYRFAPTDDAPTAIIDKTYRDIQFRSGFDDLYALDGDAIVKLDITDSNGVYTAFESLTDRYVAAGGVISFAVDYAGTAFMLTENNIVRATKSGSVSEFALVLNGENYELGAAKGAILLSDVSAWANNSAAENTEYRIRYGDILIVDTYKHRIFTVDGSDGKGLGVKLIDDDFDVPDVKDDNSPAVHNGLIRVAVKDMRVFKLPNEKYPLIEIAEGRKVIVPQYDIQEASQYALVLIDDMETGTLVQGYVYKGLLSAPLPYSKPDEAAAVATVYTGSTPIYKWPSRYSVTLDGYGAVSQGQKFDIMPFVSPYRDDYNNLWYRVSVNGREGYMRAANLSLGAYDPIFIRPAYNAEIISYEGSAFAPTYILVADGEYAKIDVTLDTGTEVEVVGAFDTSEKYTEIKYFDEKRGTLTCYVETVYLEYNGVNIVPIVAVIVIIITVILAAIIIMRSIAKRKRTSEEVDD